MHTYRNTVTRCPTLHLINLGLIYLLVICVNLARWIKYGLDIKQCNYSASITILIE